MRPLKGMVVAAQNGAVTIELENGLVKQVCAVREFRYGERVRVAYDYTHDMIRYILKEGETFSGDFEFTPPLEETKTGENPLAFLFAPLSLS